MYGGILFPQWVNDAKDPFFFHLDSEKDPQNSEVTLRPFRGYLTAKNDLY